MFPLSDSIPYPWWTLLAMSTKSAKEPQKRGKPNRQIKEKVIMNHDWNADEIIEHFTLLP